MAGLQGRQRSPTLGSIGLHRHAPLCAPIQVHALVFDRNQLIYFLDSVWLPMPSPYDPFIRNTSPA